MGGIINTVINPQIQFCLVYVAGFSVPRPESLKTSIFFLLCLPCFDHPLTHSRLYLADASAAMQVRALKDYCNNYDLTSLNIKAGDIITVGSRVRHQLAAQCKAALSCGEAYFQSARNVQKCLWRKVDSRQE